MFLCASEADSLGKLDHSMEIIMNMKQKLLLWMKAIAFYSMFYAKNISAYIVEIQQSKKKKKNCCCKKWNIKTNVYCGLRYLNNVNNIFK